MTLIEALRSVQPVTLDGEQLIQAGWVSVVQVASPDLVYVQTDSMVDKVWRVEEEMESSTPGCRQGRGWCRRRC